MILDSYALAILVAGVLAGIAIAILMSLGRDMPWVISGLYRFVRYHQRPAADDVPPSIKPIVTATIRDLERQGRLAPPA